MNTADEIGGVLRLRRSRSILGLHPVLWGHPPLEHPIRYAPSITQNIAQAFGIASPAMRIGIANHQSRRLETFPRQNDILMFIRTAQISGHGGQSETDGKWVLAWLMFQHRDNGLARGIAVSNHTIDQKFFDGILLQPEPAPTL